MVDQNSTCFAFPEHARVLTGIALHAFKRFTSLSGRGTYLGVEGVVHGGEREGVSKDGKLRVSWNNRLGFRSGQELRERLIESKRKPLTPAFPSR